MIELNTSQEATDLLKQKELTILYFYTPLCGTCKIATTILTAISPLIQQNNIYSCNVNIMPNLAQKLEIKSVPCILVNEKGKIQEKIYAIGSAAHILTLLGKYIKP